ncbi:hypothetical protein ECE50_003780 [Chitinophaga sp. Mgbs1]|uniref:Uncharacterized protein n=1 Tax=Chitinophaga solisilvae TaxID=1233460 RepID=A0A9Q5D7L4_9BACT|nr:hypothetical protein [Chitinophaga solisilvae]
MVIPFSAGGVAAPAVYYGQQLLFAVPAVRALLETPAAQGNISCNNDECAGALRQ